MKCGCSCRQTGSWKPNSSSHVVLPLSSSSPVEWQSKWSWWTSCQLVTSLSSSTHILPTMLWEAWTSRCSSATPSRAPPLCPRLLKVTSLTPWCEKHCTLIKTFRRSLSRLFPVSFGLHRQLAGCHSCTDLPPKICLRQRVRAKILKSEQDIHRVGWSSQQQHHWHQGWAWLIDDWSLRILSITWNFYWSCVT